MRKSIVIIFIIIQIGSLCAQSIDRLSSLDNNSLASLYFISQTKAFTVDYLDINLDEPTPYDRLNDLQKIDKIHFLQNLKETLKNLPKSNQNAIIDSVIIWDKMSTLISFPLDLDNTNLSEFHELIANIESTEHLVNKHITYDGQYWGSLSSSQTTEVYFDLMNYLFHLNNNERLRFFKHYFDVAYDIGKK